MPEAHSISSSRSSPLGRYPGHAPGAFAQRAFFSRYINFLYRKKQSVVAVYTNCIFIVIREI
jgi:hypothetical protein